MFNLGFNMLDSINNLTDTVEMKLDSAFGALETVEDSTAEPVEESTIILEEQNNENILNSIGLEIKRS